MQGLSELGLGPLGHVRKTSLLGSKGPLAWINNMQASLSKPHPHPNRTTSVVVLNTFKFHYVSFMGRFFFFLKDCHKSPLLIPLYMYYYYYY